MLLAVFILWILMWGAAGYFTVRFVRTLVEKRRMDRYLAEKYRMRCARKNADGEIVYDPFPLFSDLMKR